MMNEMRRASAIVSLAGVAVVTAGCFGDGTGSLHGDLFVRGCSQSNDYGSLAQPSGYVMNPDFFAANPVDSPAQNAALHPVNGLTLRMQAQGTHEEWADILSVTIADDAPVAAGLNKPLPLGPDTNVRATLTLHQTCRYAESEPELDGTITFSSFGSATGAAPPTNFTIDFGDRLTATLDVTVVDRRAATLGGIGAVSATPAVAGALQGGFDFIVRPSTSEQPL
jgi:hypothetical protein